MRAKYDLILKGGTMVDPVNRQTALLDLGISGGRIAEIAPALDPSAAMETVEVTGLHVLPGIIDLHVHVSSWLGGALGHRMMARAGVTTALDMSGPIESVLSMAREQGAGLNIACIQYVRPGHTVKDTDPSRDELSRLLADSLRAGAIGLKILGGHYPLTPEATALTIETARAGRAYLAFHAGTLRTKSNFDGLREAVSLSAGQAFHLAHVNSYCRGTVLPYMQETEEALELLEGNPQIYSESYLSQFNGTNARCVAGLPESQVTVMNLAAGGFPATEKGLEDAIMAGWARINLEDGGQVILAVGERARHYWRQLGTDTSVSFPVNPEIPRLRLATAKRRNGDFAVDGISTDGGGIPRNVTVEFGLALVKLAAIRIEDFVLKTSRNPARILGLNNKGHLGTGADADVTVVDLARQNPVLTVANGRIIMFRDHVCGTGTRFITTAEGEVAVRAAGLDPLVIEREDLLPGRED